MHNVRVREKEKENLREIVGEVLRFISLVRNRLFFELSIKWSLSFLDGIKFSVYAGMPGIALG